VGKRGVLKEWVGNNYGDLLALQPSQPPLCIFNLSDTRISILPEVEEFLVVLYG
jgi:hypothetical protein